MSFKNRRLYLSGVLVMLFLFTCGSLSATKEISFLTSGYSAAMIQYLREEVAPVFLRTHGADVTVMSVGWDQRQERIMVLTAGGTPPDVVVTGFYSPYEEGSMGLLEPLDRYMQGWPYTNRFPKQLWEAMSWRGQVMAVPQSLDFRGIGYNKRLFAEAGLDPARPPEGWDEMIQYARRLTRIEGQTVSVQGFWCTDTAAGSAQQLFWFMRQAGLSEINLDTFTSNLNDPRATQALQTLLELYEAGQNRLPVLSGGFGQGRVAMRYLAPSNVASWVAADPEFMEWIT